MIKNRRILKLFFKRIYFILLLQYLLIQNNIYCQSVSAKLSKTSILIGEQTILSLEFNCASKIEVTFPSFNDTITKQLEIIDKSEIKTTLLKDKQQKILLQEIKLSSFDSGFVVVPPLTFIYKKPNDTAKYYAETQPIIMNIQPVNVDISKGIRDIKPPLEARFTFREALPYIIDIIILIAGLVFLRLYLKKRKRKEPIFWLPPKPKLPPHEIALASLEDLRNKKLWQNNKIKEFHSELSEIIRRYIEDRFSIRALEMITEDIIESINRLELNDDDKSALKELLSLADLVKFAKENPLPSEHDRSFNNAIDFVKNTILQQATASSQHKQ